MKGTNDVWLEELRKALYLGSLVRVGGLLTREILASKVVIDMKSPIVTVAARRLGYRFMCAEAAWILSGDDRLAPLAPYSWKIGEFSDDGERFFGAYGPKFRDQLDYVVGELRRDPSTRRAVFNIWRENPRNTKDYPCTLSCTFLARRGKLNSFVHMRSNDLWLGTPYDIFSASMWSAYVLLATGLPLELGCLYHSADSRHLYEYDVPMANTCVIDPHPKFWPGKLRLAEFGEPDDLIDHLWKLAKEDTLEYESFKEIQCENQKTPIS